MEPHGSQGDGDGSGARPPDPRRGPDLLPVLLLAVIVLVLVAGWWLFPLLHREVGYQDCLAAGRTDCSSQPGG